MSVDLSAVFNKLNTNTQGDSANILDNDEVKSAKENGSIFTVEEGMTSETFNQVNQRNSGKVSVFDTDANQNVSSGGSAPVRRSNPAGRSNPVNKTR